MLRVIPRAALTVAAAVLVAVGAALPASAHAALVSTDPADGAVVAAPTALTLVFNEDVAADFTVVTLTSADGGQLDLAAPAVDGPTVTQPVPALDAGAWTVAYRVVSEDGHPVQGSSTFTTTAPTTTAPTAAPTPAGAPATPTVTTTTTAPPTVADTAAVTPATGSGVPAWVLVAVPLVLVGAGAAAALGRRSRR